MHGFRFKPIPLCLPQLAIRIAFTSTVRVFNSSGQQVVAPAHWVGHELVLDCASLPDGMYHVQWGDDAGFSRFGS